MGAVPQRGELVYVAGLRSGQEHTSGRPISPHLSTCGAADAAAAAHMRKLMDFRLPSFRQKRVEREHTDVMG